MTNQLLLKSLYLLARAQIATQDYSSALNTIDTVVRVFLCCYLLCSNENGFAWAFGDDSGVISAYARQPCSGQNSSCSGVNSAHVVRCCSRFWSLTCCCRSLCWRTRSSLILVIFRLLEAIASCRSCLWLKTNVVPPTLGGTAPTIICAMYEVQIKRTMVRMIK